MINLIYRIVAFAALLVVLISLVVDIFTNGVLIKVLSVDRSVSFGELTIIILLLAQSARRKEEKP